jgi:hypothetical protein
MVAAALFVCMLALDPGRGESDRPPVDPVGSHVRASDVRARSWIRSGASQSPTFRSLLARLSSSDLIVYVEIVDRIPGGAAGQLYFVTATASARYVRIELVADGSFGEMVALVGHELQHAMEIADAPRVRDRQTLATLYLGMFENALGSSQYDSVAARVAEDRIRRELDGYRGAFPGTPAVRTLARLRRHRDNHGPRFGRCASAHLSLGTRGVRTDASQAQLRRVSTLSNGMVFVCLMNGLQPMDGQRIDPSPVAADWRIRGVGDINGDMSPDVIWQNQADGSISAWLMNGFSLVDAVLLTPPAVTDLDWRIVGPR